MAHLFTPPSVPSTTPNCTPESNIPISEEGIIFDEPRVPALSVRVMNRAPVFDVVPPHQPGEGVHSPSPVRNPHPFHPVLRSNASQGSERSAIARAKAASLRSAAMEAQARMLALEEEAQRAEDEAERLSRASSHRSSASIMQRLRDEMPFGLPQNQLYPADGTFEEQTAWVQELVRHQNLAREIRAYAPTLVDSQDPRSFRIATPPGLETTVPEYQPTLADSRPNQPMEVDTVLQGSPQPSRGSFVSMVNRGQGFVGMDAQNMFHSADPGPMFPHMPVLPVPKGFPQSFGQEVQVPAVSPYPAVQQTLGITGLMGNVLNGLWRASPPPPKPFLPDPPKAQPESSAKPLVPTFRYQTPNPTLTGFPILPIAENSATQQAAHVPKAGGGETDLIQSLQSQIVELQQQITAMASKAPPTPPALKSSKKVQPEKGFEGYKEHQPKKKSDKVKTDPDPDPGSSDSDSSESGSEDGKGGGGGGGRGHKPPSSSVSSVSGDSGVDDGTGPIRDKGKATALKLPGFPSAVQFPAWRRSVRSKVVAASGLRRKAATKFILAVERIAASKLSESKGLKALRDSDSLDDLDALFAEFSVG